jgi:hypothetical protein
MGGAASEGDAPPLLSVSAWQQLSRDAGWPTRACAQPAIDACHVRALDAAARGAAGDGGVGLLGFLRALVIVAAAQSRASADPHAPALAALCERTAGRARADRAPALRARLRPGGDVRAALLAADDGGALVGEVARAFAAASALVGSALTADADAAALAAAASSAAAAAARGRVALSGVGYASALRGCGLLADAQLTRRSDVTADPATRRAYPLALSLARARRAFARSRPVAWLWARALRDGGGGGGGDGDDDDDARPLPAGDDDGDAWTLAEALARCAAARYAPLGALLPLGAQLRVLLLHAAGVVPELASLETLTAIRAPARQPPSARGDERWARAWAGVRLDDVPGWPLWAAPVHDALREVAPSLRILFAAHAATHARAHAAPALAATPAHATAAPAHAAAGALLSAAEWQALVRGAGWGLGGLAQPQLLALYNTSGIGMSIVPDQERGRTAPRTVEYKNHSAVLSRCV